MRFYVGRSGVRSSGAGVVVGGWVGRRTDIL